MKVGTTEYFEATGLTAFREALTTQLGTHLPQYEKLLGEISSDMFNEKLVFADWPALLAEVAIRNVGYQAEAAMRARMVEHEARYQRQSEQAQILVEQAEKAWAEDRKKPAAERTVFQLEVDKVNYIAEQQAQISRDVLSYTSASYMSRYGTTPTIFVLPEGFTLWQDNERFGDRGRSGGSGSEFNFTLGVNLFMPSFATAFKDDKGFYKGGGGQGECAGREKTSGLEKIGRFACAEFMD